MSSSTLLRGWVPGVLSLGVLISLSAGTAEAQVVREVGVKSIAGVLGGSYSGAADWTFKSSGGEVLFATLDGEIYVKAQGGNHTGDAAAALSAAETGGGCSAEEDGGCSGDEGGGPSGGGCSGDGGGGCSGEEGGGCSGSGGPGLFCLQVLGPGGVLCHAGRPAPPPGWQRDPRLACELPMSRGQVEYRLRVALKEGQGSCSDPMVEGDDGESHPFVLNWSLRGIAPSGIGLQEATAQSLNH